MVFEGIGNAVHLFAAVVWIGGLMVLVLGMRPALRRALPSDIERDRIWSLIHRRFALLGTVAAAVLVMSGLMMMTQRGDPTHFLGFGKYGNTWSKILVVKHALFLGMLVLLVLLRRPRLAKVERDLIDLSLMLGVCVLIATGLLTAVK